MNDVKKAIIPIGGLGTRFLPLSKAVPKELWPLIDAPMIYYPIVEAKKSGITDIIFVLSPENKRILEYLEPAPEIERILKERKKEDILAEMKNLDEMIGDINFTYVYQKFPLGDGHAILQAAKFASQDPVALFFCDDIIYSEIPAISQLIKVFKTCQRPIVGLFKKEKEELVHYGVPVAEKIASRLYKIKKLIEKPDIDKAPSDLAVTGRYVLTPEVFDCLKKAKPNKKGEIILAEVINDFILSAGKIIYGCEIDGKWLECGDKLKWLKSNIYLAAKHPVFGPEIKKYLKTIK